MSSPPGSEVETLEAYQTRIRRGVINLIGILQAVAAGDLATEAHRERDDELGMLAVGINMMIQDIDELVESEKELREEVAAKVEELEEANLALREAQSQLVQREKMASLGQLVAGVAHELNNPIGVIYANIQLVQQLLPRLGEDAQHSTRDQEKLRILMDRCLEAASRTRQIVLDLRTFSRLDEAECKTADLNDSLDSTLNLLALREQHGIRFHRDYGELPPVECYAGQLNQVFMNLLTNACDVLDTTGRGGNIHVGTALRVARELPRWEGSDPETSIVCITVSDDGPGIPEERIDRIFEPFFTTKDVGQGVGLGLSISYQIAERHGGRLRVESREGEGATFHVEFPQHRSSLES